MKGAAFILAVGLILVRVPIFPEELPRGVLLSSRIKRHIKEELEHLPNITCLESVQREYQQAGGELRPLDTVRLEVLSSGGKEFFASPGSGKFSEGTPLKYVGSGAFGTGYFGNYLKQILLSKNASYEYKGEEKIGKRRLARYDYRLPFLWSGQIIIMKEGSARVSLHGSYWADPQTHDVIRLDLSADDIPPSLPIAQAIMSVTYARTKLSNKIVVLLPKWAEFRMVKFSGEVNHNRIKFTNCRVFEAQSTLNFGTPASPEHPAR